MGNAGLARYDNGVLDIGSIALLRPVPSNGEGQFVLNKLLLGSSVWGVPVHYVANDDTAGQLWHLCIGYNPYAPVVSQTIAETIKLKAQQILISGDTSDGCDLIQWVQQEKINYAFRTIRNTSSFALAANAEVKIDYNSTIFNDGLAWDDTNNRFICAQAGNYMFSASARIGTAAAGQVTLRIKKNGTVIAEDTRTSASNVLIVTPNIAVVDKLAVNDYVEVFAYTYTGFTSQVYNGSESFFSGAGKL